MDLKLYNNQNFSFGTTIDSEIADNCSSVYVRNCPNVSGIDILRQCGNLTRVRLNIGTVSGALSELLAYASLKGFSDNYVMQNKPRIIGTWNVNSWYTQEQLAAANNAFDGLTIVPDQSKLIDFSLLAVQTLDPSEPNYNPAVAIRLALNNLGNIITEPFIEGEGRYFLSKTEAAAVTSFSNNVFRNVTTVTDSNSIVTFDSTSEYDFESFDEIEFFSGLTSIQSEAFENCSGLTGSLTIPSGVTSIGNYAFRNCSGLTGSLTIPSGITSIGNSVFSGCSGFTGTLTIPSGVTSIGSSAFNGCSGFTGTLTLPSGITSIGGSAFNGCSGFTGTLTLPSGVTSIGSSAFSGCSGLTGSLTIPSGVTSIGASSFEYCSGFTGTLTIPSGVTSIGNYAFSRCKFINIISLATTPPTIYNSTFSAGASGRKFYVPYSSDHSVLAAYKAASVWSNYQNDIYELDENDNIPT